MPGYRAHMTVAGLTAITIIVAQNWNQPTAYILQSNHIWQVGAALLGSLFPDIDIKSRGQRLYYIILAGVLSYALWQGNTTLLCTSCVLALIPPLLPHRGLTHQLWFIILAPLSAPLIIELYQPLHTVFAFSLYLFFVIGASTHIVLDFGLKGTLKRLTKKK